MVQLLTQKKNDMLEIDNLVSEIIEKCCIVDTEEQRGIIKELLCQAKKESFSIAKLF